MSKRAKNGNGKKAEKKVTRYTYEGVVTKN
jgi:hypothetical protein